MSWGIIAGTLLFRHVVVHTITIWNTQMLIQCLVYLIHIVHPSDVKDVKLYELMAKLDSTALKKETLATQYYVYF